MPTDFSALTSVIEGVLALTLAGITAAGALKLSPGVLKWGYTKVISWFR